MDIKSDPSKIRPSALTEIQSRNLKEAQHGTPKNVTTDNEKKSDGYSVNLSPQSVLRKEEQAKAFQIAKDTSPVREDKIRQLKQQIESGTYKPDSGKIADGILREAIRDYLASDQ